ncbi:MAG: GNAT family N-acetyltransferase [Roseburia sp.]|nr:GNAT family N-acetyltransferase [Roseburia sp.]
MQIEKPLAGARILLRNYEKSDLAFSTDMWLDEENGRYLSDPLRDYIDALYQNALDTLEDSDTGYYLIIRARNSDSRIGTLCIFPDESHTTYDIGYCIHKKYWNKGYATEAVSLAADWIARQGAQSITAEVAVENTASRALLEKLGFEIIEETAFQKYNMDVCYKSYIYRLETADAAIKKIG